jgi:tetratricopeptide (TPR) repeat protein
VHGGVAAAVEHVDVAPPAAFVEPLGALLGAGGFASVWELAGGRVAKIAHAAHELARARLAREAEALAAVGAPAVPRLDAHGVLDDGRAYLVAERVSGPTLGAILAAGPITPHDALAYARGLLDAIAAVHAARFVHRDVKPDNVIVAGERVVVLDLGLARKLPDDPGDPTRAGVQVGSLEYAPPEQLADSSSVDERADLYAFGCVLYELYAGRPPFVGDAAALERAHAALRPARLSALAAVAEGIEELVHACLAKDPARRPASAAEARAWLDRGVGVESRSQHSISMVREGKQPVVLVWAELAKIDRALLASLAAHKLAIVSQRGRRVLAAALGSEHADPAAAAVAAARELAAAGARVAVHVEALRVVDGKLELERPGSAGPRSDAERRGAEIAKPEAWLPADAWTGVVMTRAFASVTRAATRSSPLGAGFRALADGDDELELVGRDALLTDLAADAAAAFAGAGPGFALIVGDAGVGKTAFAAELARRITDLGVRAVIATVPPPGAGKPIHAPLAELVGTPQGPALRAIGDALRAAARERPTAVILDDLHLAEHELYDALEYATLGGEPLPLWIAGVASPRLDTRRPELGKRAERHRRDALPPLDEDAAVALAAALLRPAEYPPLRALRRLVAIARGNPLHLAMLARDIQERGAIKERPGGAPYLDTTALDELSPVALGPWLAARELAPLGAELAALARVCAVLGGDVARDEVVAIVEAVERRGGATTTIDVDVGLAELVRAGVLLQGAAGFAFRQALVEEGVYATTDERERSLLHEAALAHWRDGGEGAAERVARHAEAAGDHAAAATAFAQLGERAAHTHHPIDADQAWSGALRHLEPPDLARGRALIGRARARYRVQRMGEAVVDLEQAAALASERGELDLEVDALLELATVLDFRESFTRAKEIAERARARLGDAPRPDLALRIELADARTLFREQRFADCADPLRRVLRDALARDLDEPATIAALLLGCVLADLRETDEAERVFADLLERCWKHDDRFHLAAAYGNRAWLWTVRGDIDRTEQDLRLVIQLARESGQAHFERVAAHNLAEQRLWLGQHGEALQLARRALALQERASEGTTHPDRLLLGRVLAWRGDPVAHAELISIVERLAAEGGLGDEDRAVLAALEAVAGRPERWADALAGLDGLFEQLRLEIGELAERHGQLPEATRAQLRDLAHRDPIWRRRSSAS